MFCPYCPATDMFFLITALPSSFPNGMTITCLLFSELLACLVCKFMNLHVLVPNKIQHLYPISEFKIKYIYIQYINMNIILKLRAVMNGLSHPCTHRGVWRSKICVLEITVASGVRKVELESARRMYVMCCISHVDHTM